VVVVGSVSLWTISHAPDDGDSVIRADSVPSEPARSPDVRLQPSPPVSGDIVGIGAAASGHVRIAGNTGDETLAVEIDHLETGGDGPVDVVLSAGTVRGGSEPMWTPAGESYDLFRADGVEQGLTVVLSDPWSLPDEVRSLVLLDADTGTVLGGAALVPSD
jgi:hypothetical protein